MLVRVSARFELARVRVIGSRLYEIWDVVMYFLHEPLINIVTMKHYFREFFCNFTKS